jgi:hypothetical protein
MAVALPIREHLGLSLICSATNSVAVVPSQRCRTSAGLTSTINAGGKGPPADWRRLRVYLGLENAYWRIQPDRCALSAASNCDSLEPPASTVQRSLNHALQEHLQAPPTRGVLFPIFQRCSDTVRVPCLRHQAGNTVKLLLSDCTVCF